MEEFSPETGPSPESRGSVEALAVLAAELGFIETVELHDLRLTVLQALQTDAAAGREAMATYQAAAEVHVQAQDSRSAANVGYRVTVGAMWLEAGEVDLGLDELWETGYQAGQTPGIESLREALESFVEEYE